MRPAPLACAVLGVAGGVFSFLAAPPPNPQILILAGDTQGYLSPCGCSSPMIGGIRRLASAVRALAVPGRTTFLDNGNMVAGVGAQDTLKAETLAQSLAAMNVTAINLGVADARLGIGGVMQIAQLSGNKLVSMSVANPENRSLGRTMMSGPFLVGGVSESPQLVAGSIGDSPVAVDDAVRGLVESAQDSNREPVLMLQGSHDEAARLAKKFPSIALIQFSSVGDPSSRPEAIGRTLLVSPGERGKHLIRLLFADGKFTGYKSVSLGPEYGDDPTVSRFYSTYLKRVTDAKLLEKLPRKETPAFAGAWACTSCHISATHIWKQSGHRLAFETLVKTGHAADPDCVSCHVVGLDSSVGFRSRSATPQLAGVGCESCHGPAAAHAQNPKESLPRLTQRTCVGCHNPENSPNFQFDGYWRKIAHH